MCLCFVVDSLRNHAVAYLSPQLFYLVQMYIVLLEGFLVLKVVRCVQNNEFLQMRYILKYTHCQMADCNCARQKIDPHNNYYLTQLNCFSE